MHFLYPGFLWAFSALLVPLVIHLFNFQRPKKILFSNVRFLKNIQQSTSAARNLKHWLLLLCRLLFLSFLILAFAQPFLSNSKASLNSARKLNKVIYLDNSNSMSVQKDGKSTLDQGLALIEKQIQAGDRNSVYNLLSNDFNPSFYENKNKEGALDLLAETKYSSNSRTLKGIVTKIGTLEKSNESWIVSDFQADMFSDFDKSVFDSSRQYHLVQVQNEEQVNCFVDSVWLKDIFLKANEQNQLSIKVKNSGNQAKSSVAVKLFIENELVGTQSISLKPNTSNTVDINFVLKDNASKNGKVEISDESLNFDNSFYFTLKTPSRIKITHIAKAANPLIQAVYANREIFDFKSYLFGNINYSDLEKADLIVLENNFPLNSGLLSSLSRCVKDGCSILVIASAVELSAFNALAEGLQFKTRAISGFKDSLKLDIQSPDIANSFFDGVFQDRNSAATSQKISPVYNFNNDNSSLLKLKNNTPMLLKEQKGKSSLYVLNSRFDNASGNFSRHPLCIPVTYKIAFSSVANFEKLYYRFGDKTVLSKPEGLNQDQIISLVKNKQQFIPEQQTQSDAVIMQLPPNLNESGIYALQAGNSNFGNIAINFPTKESILDFEDKKSIESKIEGLKNVDFKFFDDSASGRPGNDLEESVSLYKYFLAAAFLFLCLEVLLIRFFMKVKTV